TEIHMRISAPPIRHPCHYGIDMSTAQEMVAHGRSEEEIARELDCDSLAYLSLAGVYEAIRSTRDTHCDACFSGDYPLEDGESANGKFALELPLARAADAHRAGERGGLDGKIVLQPWQRGQGTTADEVDP
ncbi:MAG TPA: hypothetical protein VFM87_10730, partial [Agrococcus sp.]|nr:hypothetical protein [Agrococcus sp.]